MSNSIDKKSTVEDIRKRFDGDVERFSNLESGQVATIDAPLAMELITHAAIAATPKIEKCLDVGCGAGNNTIKLLRDYGRGFECHLNDLSAPMLEKAQERVSAETDKAVACLRGDIRKMDLEDESYDVILAAAVLHHLRDDNDWETVFSKLYALLRTGGSLWITDLVSHEHTGVHAMMWQRYADYLIGIGGKAYQEEVFKYIEIEDSPRSVTYQMNLMQKVGFRSVEILHKNSCFAAFGGVK